MPKLESVMENETLEILCHFVMKTDYVIPARRPGLVIINKIKKKKKRKREPAD